jgi:hypothetical protein
MRWTNIRPLSADDQERLLRMFSCVIEPKPAWPQHEQPHNPVTIRCGRCGKLHTYQRTLSGGRKYCDDCVRT